MEWYTAFALLLGMVAGLMLLGLPVAFSFIVANLVGAAVFMGGMSGSISAVRSMVSAIANFSLAPIPFFIFMGEVLFHSGMAFAAVSAIDRNITRVPGRLSVVAIGGGTVFAALSGSTIANTAMLGSVLMPQMRARRYHPDLAMGPIMAVGGIAMLIPPSALAVLLASLALIPVADLLVAGIVPGIIMSIVFVGYVMIRALINPSVAPAYDIATPSMRERIMPLLVHVVPLSLIFIAVLGSIFAGVASPTDSAALGALMSIALAAVYRKLTWPALITSLMETAKLTIVILFIVAASTAFAQILAFSGAADGALKLLLGLDLTPTTAAILMVAIYVVLGCFVDQVSMMLITLPFFMPLAAELDLNLVWLGILFLISIEMGLLTPPFGLLLFVMKSVAEPGTSLGSIYRAAIPFVILEIIVLALLIAVPSLVLWLPGYL